MVRRVKDGWTSVQAGRSPLGDAQDAQTRSVPVLELLNDKEEGERERVSFLYGLAKGERVGLSRRLMTNDAGEV